MAEENIVFLKGCSGSPVTEKETTNLYHYCSANEFSELIVMKQQLYFSNPINFNDPFEQNIENVGVFCFSASKPTENTLMWAHYADKHKGLCFEFKKEIELYLNNYEVKQCLYNENIENTEKQNEWNTNILKYLMKLKEIRKLEELKKDEYILDRVSYDNVNNKNEYLLTKDNSWRYENEIRMVLNYDAIKENDYQRTFIFHKQCLTGIYFGVRTSPDVVEKYKSLCSVVNNKNNPIKLYQLKHSGLYDTKKEELDYYIHKQRCYHKLF